jgi:hypothetical protein
MSYQPLIAATWKEAAWMIAAGLFGFLVGRFGGRRS